MKQTGFSLMSVLTAMAIVGILAAFAFPSYEGAVRKAKRADAKSFLLSIQFLQEKYRANNPSYTSNLTVLGFANANTQPSPDGHYTATVTAANATSYTIEATAVGNQAKDTNCVILSMDQNNTQGSKDNNNNASTGCW